MQELVAREMEPITPFVDKVGQLREDLGVSTILVMGGSGDYFDAADTVIAMEEYRPRNVSGNAADIARRYRSERIFEGGPEFGSPTRRYPDGASLDPRRGRRPESVRSSGVKAITFGTEEIDVSAVEQIVHPGQLRSIGAALLKARQFADGKQSLEEILDRIEDLIKRGGLDGLTRQPMPDLAGFRRLELAAVLNRVRTLKVINRS
jgi:predicted ABC-class ATPase